MQCKLTGNAHNRNTNTVHRTNTVHQYFYYRFVTYPSSSRFYDNPLINNHFK